MFVCVHLQPDWTFVLGEQALDLSVPSFSHSSSSIFVLGERNLYCLRDNGQIRFMKKLEFNPSCFLPYTSGKPEVVQQVKAKDSHLRLYKLFVQLYSCTPDPLKDLNTDRHIPHMPLPGFYRGNKKGSIMFLVAVIGLQAVFSCKHTVQMLDYLTEGKKSKGILLSPWQLIGKNEKKIKLQDLLFLKDLDAGRCLTQN